MPSAIPFRAGRGLNIRHLPGQVIYSADTALTSPAEVTFRFFQIIDASTRDSQGNISSAKVMLVESTLCGDVPTSGMTDLAVSDGYYVYAHVTFNTTTGAVTGRTIAAAASVPAVTSGNAYVAIGTVAVTSNAVTPTNLIYGPIIGCRNWFVTPLEYTLIGTGPS